MAKEKVHVGYVIPGWDFYNGCVHFRNFLPGLGLARRGNTVEFILLGENISEQNFKDIDVVIFSRAVPPQIVPIIDLVKRLKKKIIWETDDDLENIDDSNPARGPIGRMMTGIKMMAWEAHAITTTTQPLADRLRQRYPSASQIYVCPNALDLEQYKPRKEHPEDFVIGWSGGCSHSTDLLMVLDPLIELNKKVDFTFVLQGFTLGMVDAQEHVWKRMLDMSGANQEQYYYIVKSLEMCSKFKEFKRFMHVPFYPTEMVPKVFQRLSFDIGLAPLLDTEFNHAKSCIKYYEYAAVGTTTMASNVIPYNVELNYTINNTKEDWMEQTERMITDKDFRENTLKEQEEWMRENRDLAKVAETWEKAFLEVVNG